GTRGSCYYVRRRNSGRSDQERADHLMATTDLDLGRYKLGWSDVEDYIFKPKKGVNADIVREMSWMKGEPDWMRDMRLKALRHFERKPMLEWFAQNMPTIDFENVYYYIKPTSGQVNDWDMLPESVKATYEKLGIPEAERKFLAGVTAQYESEVVYHKNRDELAEQGVLFADMDTAVREWPDLVKPYFGSVIPPNDNKFAALNSAVWSGGSFIYVPPNTHVEMPLQAYFRINAENMGQYGRTLIIVDEGSSVHYAAAGQHQLAGAQTIHAAPETPSLIASQSFSKVGSRTSCRGIVRVDPGCSKTKSHVRCDADILEEHGGSDTLPYMETEEQD